MTRILTRPIVCTTLTILASLFFICDYVGKIRVTIASGFDVVTFIMFTADFLGKVLITLIALEKIVIKRLKYKIRNQLEQSGFYEETD